MQPKKRIDGQYEIYELGDKAYYIYRFCNDDEKKEEEERMKKYFGLS